MMKVIRKTLLVVFASLFTICSIVLIGINRKVNADGEVFAMDYGAYARLKEGDEDYGGLRFRVKFDQSIKDTLDSNGTLGFTVMTKSFYEGIDDKVNFKYAEAEGEGVWQKEVDESLIYQGYDVKDDETVYYFANLLLKGNETTYGTEFVAIANMKVGNVYKYATFEEGTNVKSLYYVVNTATFAGYVEEIKDSYSDWYGTESFPVTVDKNQYSTLIEIKDVIKGMGYNFVLEEDVVDEESIKSEFGDKIKSYYTVTFKNEDGTVLESKKVLEGEMPTCSVTPTKDETLYKTFSFNSWDNELSVVDGDAVYVATYTDSDIDYSGSKIASFASKAYNETVEETDTIYPGYTLITKKQFATPEGAIDGALDITLKKDVEGTGNYKKYYFNVDLPRAITSSDVENFDGIAIRFKIYETDEPNEFFRLGLVSEKHPYTYEGAPANPVFFDVFSAYEWNTCYISKEDLDFLEISYPLNSVTVLITKHLLSVNDNIETSIYLDDISYYKTLSTPSITLNGTNLSWNSVENATGYVVHVNGQDINTTSTTFDMTEYLSSDYSVCVKAVNNGLGFKSSTYSNKVYNISATSGKTIANFNSLGYEGSILNASIRDVNSEVLDVKYATPEGSDGAVDLTILKKRASNGNNREYGFRVKLPTTITQAELANHDGISFRFKLYDSTETKDNDDKHPNYRFGVITEEINNYNYQTLAWQDFTFGEWHTFYLTKSEINRIGIKGSFDELSIILYRLSNFFNSFGKPTTSIYLDDISFYDNLSTPTNLALYENTNILTWDAVEGASEYAVNINGEETNVNTNSFVLDPSALLNDLSIKVKAINSTNSLLNSDYSDAIYHVGIPTGLVIANFNNEGYVDFIDQTTIRPTWSNLLNVRFIPAESGVHDGAVAVLTERMVTKPDGSSNSNSCTNYFNVNLPRTITQQELAEHDGVVIRFKMIRGQDYGTDAYKIGIVSSDANCYWANIKPTWSNAASTSGGWVEYKMPTADFARIGLTTDLTQLTIAIYASASAKSDDHVEVECAIDYIAYYDAE